MFIWKLNGPFENLKGFDKTNFRGLHPQKAKSYRIPMLRNSIIQIMSKAVKICGLSGIGKICFRT